MQVPLLDLKPQYAPLAAEIQAAIERVCASQHFILGPAVKELEAAVAAYSQCRFGIGVSSGTDALLLALMALEHWRRRRGHHQPVHVLRHRRAPSRVPARARCSATSTRRRFNLSAAGGRRASSRSSASGATGSSCTAAAACACARSCRCICTARSPTWRRSCTARAAHGLQVIEDAAQAIGAADARGRRAGSLWRRRLPVVLSDEEPRCLRRCRHVRHERCRAGRAHGDPAGARRQAEVLPRVHRRQLPHR